MRIHIIVQTDGADLICLPISRDRVGDPSRLVGRSPWIDGNPYGVYRTVIESFAGGKSTDHSVTVSRVTSGTLLSFLDEWGIDHEA